MDNYEELRNIIFNSITWNDLSTLMNTLRLYPIGLEVFNNCLNTPLLYACHCGQSQIVEYLLRLGANYKHLNIFGQNALTLATYSGDIETCMVLLKRINYNEFNMSGLLTPLCVAALQGNIDIAKIYLTLETPKQNIIDCPSKSIHGICPLHLARIKGDTNMIDLLQSKHQLHLIRTHDN